MRSEDTVRVWDPWVRIAHWLLAAAFLVAYLSAEEGSMSLHAWAGYIVGAYVVWRLIWGVVGPGHARFSDFVTSPRAVVRYFADLAGGQARRYEGHNPPGAWMIVALLITLGITVGTGLVVYAGEFSAGPLAAWLGGAEGMAEALEEVHEVFANATLALVVFHVIGVLMESVLHRENLVASMIHGRKRHD